MAGAFLAGGLSLVAVSFAITGVTVLIASFAVGLTFAWKKIPIDTMVQESLPDGYRGRVFAAYDVVYNLARVIAAAVAIPMLPHVGVSGSVAVVGILFLLWTPVLPRWIGGKPSIVLRFSEGKAEVARAMWGGVEEPVEVSDHRTRNATAYGWRFRLRLQDGSLLTSAVSNWTACGIEREAEGGVGLAVRRELLIASASVRIVRSRIPRLPQSPPIPASRAHGAQRPARAQVLRERSGDQRRSACSPGTHAVERHHASAELGQRPSCGRVGADDEDHDRQAQGSMEAYARFSGRDRRRQSAAPTRSTRSERRRKSGVADELARFAMIRAAASAPSQ